MVLVTIDYGLIKPKIYIYLISLMMVKIKVMGDVIMKEKKLKLTFINMKK